MQIVECYTCEYRTLRTNKEEERCSKCGGIVKIIANERERY